MAETYDVVIIGGGQAGVPLASDLGKAGRRVALVERGHLGGSCVNFGCTPTKAAIASARVAHLARRASEFGLRVPAVEADFPAVIRRARALALRSRHSLDEKVPRSPNVTLLRGHARLEGRDGARFRVRAADRTLLAPQVVLDTGTRTRMPPLEGLSQVPFLHSENWLDRQTLPDRLVVLGGGYIGLEIGQFYARLGSRVTVVEESDRVASKEDPEVSEELRRLLEAEGILFRLGARARRVAAEGGRLRLVLEGPSGDEPLEATDLFVATGREPATDDLGLETVGVARTREGYVEVDERLSTGVSGIWAAGDIRGGPMFTHTSWDDYRVLFSQLEGDGSRTTNRVVPFAIYTDPELGRVGMTEAEARAAGREIRVARFEMEKCAKAKEIGETQGFIKVVADARSREILGAAVLAASGSELVHLFVDVMNAGAPYTAIREAVHIHPTLAEAVQSAVAALDEASPAERLEERPRVRRWRAAGRRFRARRR